MKENDYFFANKKFEKAELNFTDVNLPLGQPSCQYFVCME